MRKYAFVFITRLFFHDVLFNRLNAERKRRQRIGDKIQPQQQNRSERRLTEENESEKYSYYFAQIAGQQKMHRFANIIKYTSALFYGGDNRCKIIIGQRHRSGALCNICAGNAHCTADIRSFQSRRIVYTVAGHCDYLALILPSFDNADFVFGRNTRVYANMFKFFCQFIVAHSVKLNACNRYIALSHYAKLFCYCRSGDNMVACYHNCAYACRITLGYSLLCLFARRINQSDKSDKLQIILQIVIIWVCGYFIKRLYCNAKHSQCLFCHCDIRLFYLFTVNACAALDNNINSALCNRERLTLDYAYNRHQLAVGIKRQLCHSGICHIYRLFIGFHRLHRSFYNSGFGRIADIFPLAVHKLGVAVAAESAKPQQCGELFCCGNVIIIKVVHLIARISGNKRHSVFGERARFIRANNRRAAKRFNRRQTADNRVFLDHSLHAHCKHDCNNRGQAFGDCGNSKRNGGHKHFKPAESDNFAENEYDYANYKRYYAKALAEFCKLKLKRRDCAFGFA